MSYGCEGRIEKKGNQKSGITMLCGEFQKLT
jgi:hypothetical protein